jgi:hypothetical protein
LLSVFKTRKNGQQHGRRETRPQPGSKQIFPDI